MKTISIALLISIAAFGQAPVNISSGPPTDAFVTLTDPGGSGGAPLYIGQAAEFQQPTSACSYLGSTCVKRTGSTLTSIGDSSNTSTITTATAHGYWIGQRITISGATVDTDLNGTYLILTIPSSTTATITTASVTDATYTESTLQISTTQPLTTQSVWTIQAFKYDASNYLISAYFAVAITVNPVWRGALAWSNRTSY